MKNNRISLIVAIVAVLLLIPLIAMQFTEEVNWKLADFGMASVLLLSALFLIDFVFRNVKKAPFRIALSISIVIALILIWAELAVGILDKVQ